MSESFSEGIIMCLIFQNNSARNQVLIITLLWLKLHILKAAPKMGRMRFLSCSLVRVFIYFSKVIKGKKVLSPFDEC